MPALPPKITTLLLFCLSVWLWQPVYSQKQVVHCTPPQFPLMVQSKEASRAQLALARAEGDSVDKCTGWVLEVVGARGGRVHAGDYIVTYAITRPEGYYMMENNSLGWYAPVTADNAHLWVFVQDASDHRIVPGLIIRAGLVNGRGSSVFDKTLPYGITPLVNGYGDNFRLPAELDYQLYLAIAPPRYHRHDPYNGDRFTSVVEAVLNIKVSRDNLNEELLSASMEKEQGLASGIGHAYKNALKEMFRRSSAGKDTVSGDYLVAFADEYAEAYWYYNKNKKLTYMVSQVQSSATNAHVEVAICDAKTGRFMHDLTVSTTLYYKDGELGTGDEPFMWHPWLYHYGANWRVPRSGRQYRLHVEAQPPVHRRYGRVFGRQFTRPAVADFSGVLIRTGEK